ncbi:MAG: AsmA-like C-terminal region-containing protein [Bacteroidota bacterium]
MAKSKKRLWKRIIIGFLVLIVLFIGVSSTVIYFKQDDIVQEFITTVNEDFSGRLEIKDTHISPFANFPYISIDLEEVKIYEGKSKTSEVLLDIKDVYLGFDLITLLSGTVEIKSLKLQNGFVKLVQHKDGSFNISNALTTEKEIEDTGEEFHMDLKGIHLVDIDLLKLNEENNVLVEAFIDDAVSEFSTSPDHVKISLETQLILNLIIDDDTTFVHNKHVDLLTRFDYTTADGVLSIQLSELLLEKALFLVEGNIDIEDDMNLDLTFTGNKPNFDLFLAFAPEELNPILQRYDNGGKIFFEASVKGKSINGHNPLVEATFGCEEAFINNTVSNKKIEDLFFKAHFTTGENHDASTMAFKLTDFSAKPEAGEFRANLDVKNFESPEIEMQVASEFDLDFLADFFNIDGLTNTSGSISLTMNFHDIIDLANPERSIERLNESYFTELEVKDLSFKSDAFHLPIDDLDIKASMDGHEATIDRFSIKMGNSDLEFTASITDLPAILHHTDILVDADLDIKSNMLDIAEMTQADSTGKGMNEQIQNMSMKFRFNSSAKAFTESPNLPIGEFFIESLYAKFTNYPHTLHDFHADVYVDDEDFRIIDFTGMIDKSDFHFNGRLKNYDLWFSDDPLGDTRVEFSLNSTLLQLQDLFSYGGENYVPEDYRHEEFRDLKVHGFADLHFDKGLKSSDISIDQLEAKMKVHDMRFEKFKGRVHYEGEHLLVENLRGKLGKSEFQTSLRYYLGEDTTIQKRDNHFELIASHLDFDEIFAYNPPPADKVITPEDHEAGFNIFEVPFSNMTFDFDIKKLNYHRYLIDDFFLKARMQPNHYIYVDTMSLAAAGGRMDLKGYFNGSNPKEIYLSPVMNVYGVDLDQLLFKFENFGQDHLVSENLHGRLSGNITGQIHMHKDLVPIIDDSEIHIDMRVVDGSLNNYTAFEAMSSYFKDKNLNRVRFDTLNNHLDIEDGTLTIPNMKINTSLGYFEVSGKQDMDTTLDMEYYLRVPWKVVTRAASQKLFGGKKEEVDPEQVDEIEFRDEDKRVRFLNLKITGNPEDYRISLGKDKKKKKKSK